MGTEEINYNIIITFIIEAYGQIPPTIGAGYYYFGFILAPIISILFVKLSLVYYDKAQKINKIY